jgi:hypothetical protein
MPQRSRAARKAAFDPNVIKPPDNHENTENVGSGMKNTLEPAEQQFSAEYVTP